jgi:VanZ family protein
MSSTFILRVVGAFGICLVILLSVIPAEVQVRTGSSKGLEHAVAYLVLALVLGVGYRSFRWATTSIAILLTALSGALELIQFWCPGRTPSVADWFAGVFGAIAGVALCDAAKVLRKRYFEGQAPSASSIVASHRGASPVSRSQTDVGTLR